MTFRQVHRSGEHWNFLIIVSSQRSRANLERLRLRLEKTIPVPAPDPAPSKIPGGSGSGSGRSCAGSGGSSSASLLHCRPEIVYQQCPPSMPCSWPGQHLSDTVRRITALVSIGIS